MYRVLKSISAKQISCVCTTFLIMLCAVEYVSAGQSIAVIPWHTGNDSLDVIADECAKKTEAVVREFGVFEPCGASQIRTIRESLMKNNPGEISANRIKDISDYDRTVIIVVSREGIKTSAAIHLVKKNEEYVQKMFVKTKIQSIIPNLVVREIIRMHENSKIEVTVKKVQKNGTVVIDAGDFNHIVSGDILSADGVGTITILSAGRFESVGSSDASLAEGQKLEISSNADTRTIKDINEREIHQGIVRTYGAEYTIQKGVPDPEKRFFEGALIVSMGGSVVLSSYGSFLSTYYMGFKNPEPAYSGMLVSASLEFGALLYTPFSTDKSKWKSYLPVESSKKTNRDLRLQKYLWSTLPATFAVTYCDQLSYQYELRRVLPPLFDHPDCSAGILSVLIPGGGLFYKGYRLAGWSFYCSELALGGYAVAELGSRKSKQALIALGAVKVIEVVTAVLISNSYTFYRDESNPVPSPALSFNIFPDEKRRLVYTAGMTVPF